MTMTVCYRDFGDETLKSMQELKRLIIDKSLPSLGGLARHTCPQSLEGARLYCLVGKQILQNKHFFRFYILEKI